MCPRRIFTRLQKENPGTDEPDEMTVRIQANASGERLRRMSMQLVIVDSQLEVIDPEKKKKELPSWKYSGI